MIIGALVGLAISCLWFIWGYSVLQTQIESFNNNPINMALGKRAEKIKIYYPKVAAIFIFTTIAGSLIGEALT